MTERRALIDRGHDSITISRQCGLVGLSRSTFYYRPAETSQAELSLLRSLDELFTAHPYYGSRRLAQALKQNGLAVGRKRIGRLMKVLGLDPIRPRPKTSQKSPGHRIYPYLLRGRKSFFPNDVWATDITYVRLRRGFAYLVAHLDWASRYVLSWRLSSTLDVIFCMESLEEALGHGKPKIHNSDQGSQFTSDAYLSVLQREEIAISMDGRGRWADNIFIERLWRTVKWECLYLSEIETPREASRVLGEYFQFYNSKRPHQSLDYATPYQVWCGEVSVNQRSEDESLESEFLPP